MSSSAPTTNCPFRWKTLCAAVQPWHLVNVLAVAALMYGLGHTPLLDPDEGRYAEIPREMLERGDLVAPTLNYVPYWEKPPLFYWLNAASLRALGESAEAARLATSVLAVLGLLVCWWLARVTFGSRAARWAPALLAGSWMYFVLARVPIIDMTFSVLMAAALTAWWSGDQSAGRGRTVRWAIAGLFLGLSVLAKGPVALVLIPAIIVVYLVLQRRWRDLLPGVVVPAAVAVAVCAPWFVAMSQRHPDFAHYFFVVQHIQRFLGQGTMAGEHDRSPYFFLAILGPGALPWSVLWPGMLVWLFGRWRGLTPEFRRVGYFLLSWAVLTLLFFSASSCKLIPYILPMWWPLAVATTAWLVKRTSAGGMAPFVRSAFYVFGIFMILFVIGTTLAASRQDIVPPAELRQEVAIFQLLTAMSGALFLLVGLPGHVDRRLGLLMMAGLLPLCSLLPAFSKFGAHFDLNGVLPPILEKLPANTTWTIAQYNNFNQSLPFRTHRRVVLIKDFDELKQGPLQPDAKEWFRPDLSSIPELSRRGPLALITNAKEDDPDAIARQFGLRVFRRNQDRALLLNPAGWRLVQCSLIPNSSCPTGPPLAQP